MKETQFSVLLMIPAYWLFACVISLVIYYYNKKELPSIRHFGTMLIAAPLIIPLLAVILLYSSFAKKSHMKKELEVTEKEKKKQRLVQQLNCVLTSEEEISITDIAVAENFFSGVSMSSNHSRIEWLLRKEKLAMQRIEEKLKNPTGTTFHEDPKKPSIISPLTSIKLKEGVMIDYHEPEHHGTGGTCNFFVSSDNDIYDIDRDIFKYLEIEKSQAGAWQAFILHTAWHSMPLFWHAYYDEWVRIYSYEDWEEKKSRMIKNAKVEDNHFINWRKLETIDESEIKDKLVPKVYYKNEEAFVQCYVWNDFSGIKRCSYYINFKGEQLQFMELEQKTVISCGNGIML